MRNFAIRTVRDGTIKVEGRVFAVGQDHREYHGELDGQRFAFGLYGDAAFGARPHAVSLWGTEAEYRDARTAVDDSWVDPNPPYAVDGRLPWGWWREVKQMEMV